MIKQVAQKGLAIVSLLGSAAAQEKVEELKPLTVLAKKFDASSEDTISSVGVVTAKELERLQQDRLIDSLNYVPGIQGLSTAGLVGNTGSALIRGLPTNYSQVVVDGVKISDSTNGLGNYLANAQLGGISRLEVLRGPQSVLYGTGAAGGVIGYQSRVGKGDPTFRFFGEAGSFDTHREAFSSEGQIGALQYGVELGHFYTENDTFAVLPRHDYQQGNGALALQWQVHQDLLLKLSYRGSESELETTSVSPFGTSNSVIDTDTHLIAFNAEYQITPGWTSKLTLGYYDEAYDGNFGGSIFASDYERLTLNWNQRIEVGDELEVLAGLEFSHSDYENTSGRAANYRTFGAYANAGWRPVEPLLIEAGVRYDEHNEFDGDVAWNVGAAYQLGESGPRLRARVSQAYRTPQLLDSEMFVSAFSTQLANGGLKSEEIRGYELGLDYDFGNHQLELGVFQQELENALITQTVAAGFPSTTRRVNSSGTSKVSGFEMALKGELCHENLRYRLAWTEQDKEEVIDVPDRSISFDLSYDGGHWLVGGGVRHVTGASYGSDPVNFLATDDRTVTRLYGSYAFNEFIKLHARVENLLDENYLTSDIFGTQLEGAGRAFFVGATLSW